MASNFRLRSSRALGAVYESHQRHGLSLGERFRPGGPLIEVDLSCRRRAGTAVSDLERHSVEGKDLPYCEVLPAPGIYRSQKARASCSRSGLSMYSSGVRFCRSKRLNPTSTGCPRLTREPTRRLISRSLRRLRGSWLGGDGPELSQLMGNHVQLRYHYP